MATPVPSAPATADAAASVGGGRRKVLVRVRKSEASAVTAAAAPDASGVDTAVSLPPVGAGASGGIGSAGKRKIVVKRATHPEQTDEGRIRTPSREGVRPPSEEPRAPSETKLSKSVRISPSPNGNAAVPEERSDLEGLLPEDRIRLTKDERVLQRWAQTSAEWQKTEKDLAKRTNRPEGSLTINRVDLWRQKVEEKHLRAIAVPKGPRTQSSWPSSLRDSMGSTLVPVGNIFSGLFCPVKSDEQRGSIELVRPSQGRKQLIVDKPSTLARLSSAEARKAHRLEQTMRALKPCDPNDCAHMVIRGTDLFAEPVKRTSPSLAQSVPADEEVRTSEPDAPIVSSAPVSAAVNAVSGPKLSLATNTLLCQCDVGENAHAEVVVKNDGTTALYYQWQNIAGDGPDELFISTATRGVLLPGQTKPFVWTFFAPQTPGVFVQQRRLVTVPPLPPHTGDTIITITGISILPDNNSIPRQQVSQLLDSTVAENIARSVLENIVSSLPQPTAPASEHPRLFYIANRDLKLHYYPENFEKFRSLADETISLHRPAVRHGAPWDFSATTLKELIESLPKRSSSQRERLLQTWDALVADAAVRPEPNADECGYLSRLLAQAVLQTGRYAQTAGAAVPTDNNQRHDVLVTEARLQISKALQSFARVTEAQQLNMHTAAIEALYTAERDEIKMWGSGTPVGKPVPVVNSEAVVSFSASSSHALFAAKDGLVYTLLPAAPTESADATAEKKDAWQTPNIDTATSGLVARLVAAGANHSIAVTDDAKVVQWTLGSKEPAEVVLTGQNIVAVAASAGASKSGYALTDAGVLYSWGDGSRVDALGRGDKVPDAKTPQPLDFQGAKVVQFSVGQAHGLAITDTGAVYAWGDAAALGEKKNRSTPYALTVPELKEDAVKKVVCSGESSILLTQAGRLLSWGKGASGVLGHGDIKDQKAPKLIADLSDEKVVDVAAGARHVVALAEGAKLFSWGESKFGAVGSPSGAAEIDAEDAVFPRPVSVQMNGAIDSVYAGGSFSIAVSKYKAPVAASPAEPVQQQEQTEQPASIGTEAVESAAAPAQPQEQLPPLQAVDESNPQN